MTKQETYDYLSARGVSFEKTENNAAFVVETDLEGEFEFRGMSMHLKRGRNIIIQ